MYCTSTTATTITIDLIRNLAIANRSRSAFTLYGELRKWRLLYVHAQWNLVCSRGWLVWFTQSMYMAGRIVGTQLYGFLLDRCEFTCLVLL